MSNINDKINSLIQKRVDEEISKRVDEALSQFFGQGEDGQTNEPEQDNSIQEPNIQDEPEEPNAPAPEKTDHDLYVEEFDLLQSRPGLTRKELKEDKRWQEFLAKRPGPKMETVYNDYLCHLERERLAQENADLRKRLAEANAEFVNFKLELDRQLPKASEEIDGELERKKEPASDKPKSAKRKPKSKKRYENLKKFIADQKLTQLEFVDLIGIKEGASEKAKQVWLSSVINDGHKNLRPFWHAVKKAFNLTPEQMAELKELKKVEKPLDQEHSERFCDDDHLNSLVFTNV